MTVASRSSFAAFKRV